MEFVSWLRGEITLGLFLSFLRKSASKKCVKLVEIGLIRFLGCCLEVGGSAFAGVLSLSWN